MVSSSLKKPLHFILHFIAIAALVACALRMMANWPQIGGVDFYYYISNARDWIQHSGAELSPTRYFYFPGIYVFWGMLIKNFGPNLSVLQYTYIGILLLNALLCGFVVNRYLHSLLWSILATIVYLFFIPKIEGLSGCTEPIATLFFLSALLLWNFEIKEEKLQFSPLFAIILMTIGVFVKQQSILILGTIGLITLLWTQELRQKMGLIVAYLGLFIFTLLFFFWLETGSLAPLTKGLSSHDKYEHHGSFWMHISGFFNHVQPLGYGLILCMLFFLYSRFKTKKNSTKNHHISLIGAFGLLALIPLVQFKARGYLHYGLYSLPFLVVSSVLLIHWITSKVQFFCSEDKTHLFKNISATVVIIFATYQTYTVYSNPILQTYKDIENARYQIFCNAIVGETIYLIPNRENAFYWICNKRPFDVEYGYSWPELEPEIFIQKIETRKAQSIFLFQPSAGAFEQKILAEPNHSRIIKALITNGYQSHTSNEIGTLYIK